jgi:hypothetical protein
MPLCTILTKWPAPLAPQCAGRDGREDRIEVGDDLVLAADHQAEAALEAENAAGRADVHVVDTARGQLLGLGDVVSVVAVATVDDDVARLHKLRDLIDDAAGDRRRHHHPGDPRLLQLGDEVGQRFRSHRPLTGELRHRLGIHIRDHHLVAVTHQPAREVGAHPPKSHHSQLHRRCSFGSEIRTVSRPGASSQ